MVVIPNCIRRAGIVIRLYVGLLKTYYKPQLGNLIDEQLAELLKARLKSLGPELAAVVGKRHRSFDAVDTAKKNG